MNDMAMLTCEIEIQVRPATSQIRPNPRKEPSREQALGSACDDEV